MDKLIVILKSIKFWTILGVISSLIGLYYTFNDDMEKNALAISVGNHLIKPPKSDQEVVIVNLIYGFKESAPLLLPMPFGIANISNKTVENVAMYYHLPKEWEAYCIRNTSFQPTITLDNLYTIDPLGSIKAFENHASVFCPSITPKTSVGSVGGENGYSNIYLPRVTPAIGENGYTIRKMPKFLLTIHGDNSEKVSYTIRLVHVYLITDDSETMQKIRNELLEVYGKDCSSMTMVFSDIDKADNKLYDIAKIPFFKLKTLVNDAVSLTK